MSAPSPQRSRAEAASRPLAPPARSGVMQRLYAAQQRERDLVLAEFVKVKGLMPLLMKHRNGGAWTRAERIQLHEQLRALGHLSPYLVILALPGSFAFLPVLAWWLDRRRHQRQKTGDS